MTSRLGINRPGRQAARLCAQICFPFIALLVASDAVILEFMTNSLLHVYTIIIIIPH